MNSKLDEVLRATKYFEDIVDVTGCSGLSKMEAVNKGVTELTGFNPLRSMGMNIGPYGDEDGNKSGLCAWFDHGEGRRKENE